MAPARQLRRRGSTPAWMTFSKAPLSTYLRLLTYILLNIEGPFAFIIPKNLADRNSFYPIHHISTLITAPRDPTAWTILITPRATMYFPLPITFRTFHGSATGTTRGFCAFIANQFTRHNYSSPQHPSTDKSAMSVLVFHNSEVFVSKRKPFSSKSKFSPLNGLPLSLSSVEKLRRLFVSTKLSLHDGRYSCNGWIRFS